MVDTQKFPSKSPEPSGEGALQPGAVLQNRYRITGVIGVGGMGSVYQARDLHFPNVTRYVAVKEMFNLSTDQGMREMALKTFERESDMLASLSHPAVPEIYDYFPSKTRAYLVMEYINGRDLEALINSSSETFPVETVLQWAIALCDVLGYLHRQDPEPVIFRDVKPSNIMIDQHNQLRLVDFGIAKVFQPDQKHTMIGTEGYSAPEQYRGEASPASDVYGIGATLHHLLTRRDPRLEPPFTFSERPIRETNPQVSPEFEAIIMTALEFDASNRYTNASLMKAELEKLSRPVFGGMPRVDLSSSPADVVSQEVGWGSQIGAVKPMWQSECEGEIRTTPAIYRNTLFVGATDNNLYALNLEDGSFRWKTFTDAKIVSSPAVAEREGLVVFGSLDTHLYAVNVHTREKEWRVATNGAVQSSPTIAHGHVFFGSDDGRLYAVRLSSGKVQWTWEGSSEIRSRPLVTGDLIVVGMNSGDVVGTDLSGKVVWRFKAKRAVVSSPQAHEGIVVFGSTDWQVYAVEMGHGFKVWEFRTSKPVYSSAAIGDDKVFIGSVDGHLYAIDLSSGKERWSFETGHQITSSPVYSEGAVYFGGIDGKVYCLEAKNGNLMWSFETGGPIPASPIVHDGVVYIGSLDHHVYALKA